MPFRLLKYGLSKTHPVRNVFRWPADLKPSYDVVIIGGGGHGLATAYYLARYHNIRNVAVLEKDYIGGGNTGRNTAIIRSNYLTAEGVHFYDESVRLLVNELPHNLLDALRLMEKDKIVREGFGDSFTKSYVKLKMDSWNDYTRSLTQWERDNTLDC